MNKSIEKIGKMVNELTVRQWEIKPSGANEWSLLVDGEIVATFHKSGLRYGQYIEALSPNILKEVIEEVNRLSKAQEVPIKPKPCPRCGCQKMDVVNKDNVIFLVCKSCSLQGQGGSTEEEAIKMWNRQYM